MPIYARTIPERLNALEDEIAKLKSANSRRGALNVVQGGTLDVLADDGTVVARIGQTSAGNVSFRVNYPDGSPAMIAGKFPDGRVETIMYRDDGTIAFRIGGAAGQPQFFAGYDRTANIVVGDDTTSAVGLAVPYIPWGPFASLSAPTDVTTSTTFVTLQAGQGYKMNPRITAQVLARASDGTTAGEVRFTDEDGTQIGSTIAIPAGAFGFYNLPPASFPGTFKEAKSLNIQARVTAGAGTIGVRGVFAQGLQS